MSKCTAGQMEFGRLGRRVLSADFNGGALNSDGGLMLLRRVDERIGLSRSVAAVLSDARNPDRITHDMRALVAQRLYALCCGYEGLNDHGALRRDPLMQTAVGVTRDLGPAPTLCRLENAATQADAASYLYDTLYCARGEAENRTKEAQLDLFGTRASCHDFLANQIRLLLAALAYTLMISLRRLARQGTALQHACAATLRVRRLKIGVAIIRNTRRIRLMFASHHPYRDTFLSAAQALAP